MMNENIHRPDEIASEGMASEEQEKSCKEHFPYTSMSPEEYAARRSHRIACFGFHHYCYKDKELEQWLLRLGQIIFDQDLIAHYRKILLTPEERKKIEQEAENIEW